MIDRWITWLNYSILGLAALLGILMGVRWLIHSNELVFVDPKSKQSGLPKGAFEMPQEAYNAINGPFLALESAPPSIQLPDLRQQLVYNGRNGRPDASSDLTVLHFCTAGNKKTIPISPGEKIYLACDRNVRPARYFFSPDNEKTALWFEAAPNENNEVTVKVFMEDEKGELITQPETHAQFRMPERDFTRNPGEAWDVGTWRVDGTLLARQRARWFGPDRFLEKHGGKEFGEIVGKQRIDFGEGDDIYFVFVQTGDCLIWSENKWRVIEPGKDSANHPLMVVKKVDDRLMTFEIWDVDGKGKVPLNLLRSTEPWAPSHGQMIQQTFKFVGARTRTQCMFEINKERMIIRPSDWLLMSSKGWRKLDKPEEIDQFVQRKLVGMLFVFEGWSKKEDKQVMLGTLYNPTRSDCQTVELAVQSVNPKAPAKNEKEKPKNEADNDEKDEADAILEKMISNLTEEEIKVNPRVKALQQNQRKNRDVNK